MGFFHGRGKADVCVKTVNRNIDKELEGNIYAI